MSGQLKTVCWPLAPTELQKSESRQALNYTLLLEPYVVFHYALVHHLLILIALLLLLNYCVLLPFTLTLCDSEARHLNVVRHITYLMTLQNVVRLRVADVASLCCTVTFGVMSSYSQQSPRSTHTNAARYMMFKHGCTHQHMAIPLDSSKALTQLHC